MKFSITLLGVEVISVDLHFPRLGVFAPNMLPDSDEWDMPWTADEDDESAEVSDDE